MRRRSYEAAGLTLPDGWNTDVNPYVGTTRTNWPQEIFRTALYHRHNVALNSGGKKFKNRLTFSLDNNEGIVKYTYKDKIALGYRGEYQVNKWIKFTEDLSFNVSSGKGADTDSDWNNVISQSIRFPQSASVYKWDGSKYGGTANEDPEYIAKYGNFGGIHGDIQNPYRKLDRPNFNKSSNFHTTTAFELGNFDKVKGLKFVSRFTYYLNNGYSKSFKPIVTEVGSPDLVNNLSESASRTWGWKTENTLTYDRTFGKHTVGALLSTTADYWEGRGLSATATGFSDESESLLFISNASSNSSSDYFSGPDANQSIIARLSYSYNDRYFVTASWRRDYAGRLPSDYNHGDFPAVTGAWKISSEPFFNKTDAVSLLKIRASWGRVGNLGSIGVNYKSASLSGFYNWEYCDMFGLTNAVSAKQMGTGYYVSRAINPSLTWETSEQTDLGIDAAFFSDRLSVTVDVYNKRTYNLIQSMSTGWPATMGLSAMLVNQGEVKNRGIELSLGWKDTVGNWTYFVNGNAGYNKNWVSDIGITNPDGSKGVWTGGGSFRSVPYIYQTAEGQPLGSYYMIKCLGIFQNVDEVNAHSKDGNLIQPNAVPGDLIFEDYNDDGKIDDGDRQYCGNQMPDLTYAFNAGFSWKNLSFSMMFQGVQGAQCAYMGKYSLFMESEGNYNRGRDILNSWTPENPNTNIPRTTRSDTNKNYLTASTWYLEDTSYLRLKNLTVTYDFTSLLRKVKHFNERNSSASIYFSGENLLTFTKYSGLDPECGGYDPIKYPVSRVLSLGVKLTY